MKAILFCENLGNYIDWLVKILYDIRELTHESKEAQQNVTGIL